jgi:hypothetical protein
MGLPRPFQYSGYRQVKPKARSALNKLTEVIHTTLRPGTARRWPGTGTGPALARHWYWPGIGTGTGPALARHWPGTGPALARHWPGTVPARHWHWPGTGTGPALGRRS